MGYVARVPKSVGELRTYLELLAANKGHIKGVKVNMTTNHIEVDLDWLANAGGYADFYMPIKKGKHEQAKTLIAHLLRDISAGVPPSETDVTALFDMIDQHSG